MPESVVTPGGPWVTVGAIEVRTLLDDPLGTIRVRPATTAARRFLDCDGDTWEEYEPGELKCVAVAGESRLWFVGTSSSIEDVGASHGPITEIRPEAPEPADFRSLLADALDDMAASADGLTSYSDDMTSEIGYRMKDIFTAKARELREAVTGG
ncbi:hypothetical protein [Streptomyces sp. NPDC006638]|uniref:hypothetical protein n=1 Tax=Streptomyces sp. NPDC006638 TaxID=3157183 RepID=UPI0033B2D00A